MARFWTDRLSPSTKFCLPAFLLARLFISIWGVLLWEIGWIHPPPENVIERYYFGELPIVQGWQGALIGLWQRWDGLHYIEISRDGYTNEVSSAFFPLFPHIGHALSHVTGIRPVVSLLITSNIFLLLSCILLHKTASEIFDGQVGRNAVVILLIYPFSIFLFAPYTESLALFLTLATYYLARKKIWPGSTLLGFLTGLSRGTVIPLISLIAIEAWGNHRDHKFSSKLWKLMAIISPLAGIGLFLWWRSLAGFKSYNELLFQEWGRRFSWPWQTAYGWLAQFTAGPIEVDDILNLFTLLIALAATIWAFKKIPSALMIYQLVFIFFSLSTPLMGNYLDSWGRYSLLMFPTYFSLGMWAKSPIRRSLLFGFLAILSLTAASYFFLWGWVG